MWWAIDYETNIPLAFVFGTREYKYSDELLVLIESFLLGAVDVNNNYAY